MYDVETEFPPISVTFIRVKALFESGEFINKCFRDFFVKTTYSKTNWNSVCYGRNLSVSTTNYILNYFFTGNVHLKFYKMGASLI